MIDYFCYILQQYTHLLCISNKVKMLELLGVLNRKKDIENSISLQLSSKHGKNCGMELESV